MREQEQAAGREDVLRALGDAASRLRRNLGESVASVRRFDRPLHDATTASLEALRLYTEGRDLLTAGRHMDAAPFFTRAIELDPDFAAAHVALAVAYLNEPAEGGRDIAGGRCARSAGMEKPRSHSPRRTREIWTIS